MSTITAAAYQLAERQYTVRESRRGWVIHAVVYAVVMIALIVINLLVVANTDASFFWFPFPLIGWGIGLANHYLYGVRWADRDIRARQSLIAAQAGAAQTGAARTGATQP